MKMLTRFLANILVLLVMSEYIPGLFVDSLYHAAIAVVVLALLNTFVRPIIIILTLPVSILTLGLFTFVINAGLFMFASSFLAGFHVAGFSVALLSSLVLTVVNMLIGRWLSSRTVADPTQLR